MQFLILSKFFWFSRQIWMSRLDEEVNSL